MLPLQSTKTKSSSKPSYFLFILVAIVAIGSGLLVQNSKSPPNKLPEFKKAILLPSPKPLVDVNFKDHHGDAFSIEKFKGKWSILFFGFTNCPDVCPTTMQTLKQVKSNLQQSGVWHNYQIVMVSVDPKRDTTERLKRYVPFFDPEFIGISGPIESTESFSKNLGILFYAKEANASGDYEVDHGASLILVNPDGNYAGVITAPHSEAVISEDLIALAKYAGIKQKEPKTNTAEPNSATTSSSAQNVASNANHSNSDALQFDKAWIRPAPPGVTTMAAYFELSNNSSQDIVIESSESDAFDISMIHNTVIEDEIASMVHMDALTIPAKGKVTLEPLGIHMMLVEPDQPLGLGDQAEVVLIGNDGTRYTKTITVRKKPE